MTSGSFPVLFASAMAAGGMVMRGKEYIAPIDLYNHTKINEQT
jgi:hypothetical protein